MKHLEPMLTSAQGDSKSGMKAGTPISEGIIGGSKKLSTILVVDDDALLRRAMSRILSNEKAEIKMAENGIEALEVYKAGGIDLVLSDREMPGMGGLALLKELKAIDPEVRFIAVSGGMKYEDRDKFIAQGALMVLDKPVDTRFLRLVAGLCLDGANRPKEGALKNARVLIADDEEDSREILGELIMQRLGCMVDTAENGERALELYKQGADLMITDLHMPKMNGLELIKKAREHNPEAKILVMSGGARDEEKKVCIDAGAMHMFGKPVNTHELIGLAGLILDSGK